MTDTNDLARSDAPERIWTEEPDIFDGMGFWQERECEGLSPYILATPTALASSAEVQALLREARAQGMEEAANIAVRHDLSIMSISSADMRARQIAQAIRTAAAVMHREFIPKQPDNAPEGLA